VDGALALVSLRCKVTVHQGIDEVVAVYDCGSESASYTHHVSNLAENGGEHDIQR